ncbi:MAG: DUF1492 domain-containing protein [Clostridiales bacterium]|nr:DUF1492 domain-containing protein [Clostridiales bacterium]
MCDIRNYEQLANAVILQAVRDLVDLKAEMVQVIKAVENTEFQTILEKRYLCFMSWEQIAVDLGYNVRHLYRLHEEALEKVVVP